MYSVVEAALSRHCSVLEMKFIYDDLLWGVPEDSPKVWSVEVGPALDVSRDLHKSSGWRVAPLWLQCGTEGRVPVWGWESCVLLLALCWPPLVILGRTLTSLGLSFFTGDWRCWNGRLSFWKSTRSFWERSSGKGGPLPISALTVP